MRALFLLCFAVALLPVPHRAAAQTQLQPPLQTTPRVRQPLVRQPLVHHPAPTPPQPPQPRSVIVEAAPPMSKNGSLVAEVTLADIGFVNGLRFANLGGHRDVYIPAPQDVEAIAGDLVLVFDDISAHEAQRSLDVQINEHSVAAIPLDGKSRGHTVRIALGKAKPKDGFLKLTFSYSGAASPDRCVDVRYVGDSLTVRPETAIDIDLGSGTKLDVATTARLMPQEVAIVLPSHRSAASDIATAVTVGRSLIASGRHVSYYQGFDDLKDFAKRDEAGRWTRGIVLIGPLDEVAGVIDSPLAKVAGAVQPFGTLAAVRVAGTPALVVSDGNAVSASRLFASPLLPATRGLVAASVGDTASADLPTDRVTFAQLSIAPVQAEIYGRVDMVIDIDTRRLPPGTRAVRLLLDVMVAPDGAGAKAVISAFVNERLLGSTVASVGEPTHLDLALPDGLVGTAANVHVVVEREIARGDCRFGPQGYPTEILDSSAIVLANPSSAARDFADLAPQFARGFELLLPPGAADHPAPVLGLLAEVTNQLSPETAPLNVSFNGGGAPAAEAPFVDVGDLPPAGSDPRVRFDRGRVAVTDRNGRTLLDLGGFDGGAVAQLVTAGNIPGLWIKPLSADGALPAPRELPLNHGEVAFIGGNGVALAMSTERNSVVRISYPEQVSWLTVAARFRPWIIAGIWLCATAALLFVLQRVFRRRTSHSGE